MRNYTNIKTDLTPKTINNLRHLIETSTECYGDKVIYYYKDGKEVKEFTYTEYLYRMNQLGTAFYELGLRDKHIAVIGDTHPHWVLTFLTTVNGGNVIVPLDKETEPDEIINFINISECSAVVYTDRFNGFFSSRLAEMPTVEYLIPIKPESNPAEDTSLDAVKPMADLFELGQQKLDEGERGYLDHEIDMEKLCALLFTSGTTGTSKGVMLCQRNLTAAVNSACHSMSYDHRARFVSVLPIHHTYELTCAHLAAANIGTTTFINDSLKYVVKNLSTFKPNTLVLVPLFLETFYKRIWDEIRKKGLEKKVRTAMKMSDSLLKMNIDIRRKLFKDVLAAFGGELTSIVAGGAPLDPQIVKDFYSFGVTVIQGYGITECSPLVAVNRPGFIKFDSVGWPVNDCEVKIEPFEGEENGEILVRGQNVMMGYYRNEEATKEVFTEDGWFRTGDIGNIDKEGYITITGRKKNVIILSNGKNIYPEEIEERLHKLEYIKECVVIGRHNTNKEMVITALIFPDYEMLADLSQEEILAKAKNDINEINRTLPPYKHINDVEIRTEDFEKTPTKKIKRFLLS